MNIQYVKYLIRKILFSSKLIREEYTKLIFKKRLGYSLDLKKKPETFNEKIQFRKFYGNNDLYSECSDKYAVRNYVKNKIGEEYLIPLLLVTNKITERELELLPSSFVAKATHGSGTNKIVLDKSSLKINELKKEINNFLKIDFGVNSLERFYSEIKPKIIVEEMLGDGKKIPDDYKFQCFKNNGNPKIIIQVSEGRFEDHRKDFYDEEWNFIDMKHNSSVRHLDKKLAKPKNFELMKLIVKKLSEDFEYVRVDLFNIEGKIYFGELTFCHGGGFENLVPKKLEYEWAGFWGEE